MNQSGTVVVLVMYRQISSTTKALDRRTAPIIRANITEDESEFVGACLSIYRAECGCATPVESLIVGLVLAYRHRMPRPVDIDRLVKEFHLDFGAAVEAARTMRRAYPEMFVEDLSGDEAA